MTALIDLYRVSHGALVEWVRNTYGIVNALKNAHRQRRESIAERLNLYRNKLDNPLGNLIDRIYATDALKTELRRFIPVAKEQNVSSRIVNEVASLYDRPALRVLKTMDKEFHDEEKRINLHFFHQEGHRLTNLCNETLLWQFEGIERGGKKETLRLITPDTFDAIPDPRDVLVPAGYLLDAHRASALPLAQASRLPCYELWDDTFVYLLNDQGNMVDESGEAVGTPREHGLKRIPAVLFHRREPTTAILDADYGDDIKSAHLGVALINILTKKLAKSQGENHPVLSGNLAQMAGGQVLDAEKPISLPPGVTLEMLQMKTDPEHYLKVKRDIIASVGASYGLDYQMFMQEFGSDSGSGKAYQVRREKLTELRIEQRGRAYRHEGEVVELVGFDPQGMRVDFQEQAMPTDAAEEVDLLDKKMRKGLDSPVSFMQRKDPDLSRDDAQKLILQNLHDFAMLVIAVRALNVPGDADAANPGKTPQQNGASNTKKPSNDEVPSEGKPAEPTGTTADQRVAEA